LILALYIALLLVAFFFSKRSSKRRKEANKKDHQRFLEHIRKDWLHIQAKASNCQIIKFDAIIDENLVEKENESFLEWMNKGGKKITNLVIDKRSKLVCYVEINNIKRKFEKIIHLDDTVVEVKVKKQEYISIYILKNPETSEPEYDSYYIDLEFLG
jgi:hypothetical protein